MPSIAYLQFLYTCLTQATTLQALPKHPLFARRSLIKTISCPTTLCRDFPLLNPPTPLTHPSLPFARYFHTTVPYTCIISNNTYITFSSLRVLTRHLSPAIGHPLAASPPLPVTMPPPDIPSSRQEADDILRKILEYRDTAGEYGVKAMTQAMEVIAKKLYSKSTPFIAELIQNADDNPFRNGIPSLEFTLVNGNAPILLVECNEWPGLTGSQVDSLSDVGNSTKKQQAGTQRTHTGEKGIGFKSVFKVADVVDIRSGFFEFRLDNTKKLGMLRPLVHDFPMPKRPGWTQILLHIRSSADYERVYRSLKDLKPEQMLFLRSLRRLQVNAPDFNRSYSTHVQDVAADAGIKSLVISDDQGERTQRYFLLRSNLNSMSSGTEERMGVSSAEMILGFPISSPTQGRSLPTQNAYAFLPICDFGFKVHSSHNVCDDCDILTRCLVHHPSRFRACCQPRRPSRGSGVEHDAAGCYPSCLCASSRPLQHSPR